MRARTRSDSEIGVHRGDILTEILRRDAGVGLVDFLWRDDDFLRPGFLNLQRFVDQIAQHLIAQPLHFRVRNLVFIRGSDQRQRADRHRCPVMTWPFTIAVALRMFGSFWPSNCTSLGMFSAFRCAPACAAAWHRAERVLRGSGDGRGNQPSHGEAAQQFGFEIDRSTNRSQYVLRAQHGPISVYAAVS